MPRVSIHRPAAQDEHAFLAAAARSRDLHHPWVEAPATAEDYAAYLARFAPPAPGLEPRGAGFLIWADGDLAGWANLGEIVRGAFGNAYLGYAAFVPWAGRGVMREGLALVLSRAFAPVGDGGLGLHRVEANIQPGNAPSRALVEGLGFRHEGFSPRYLRIAGDWRDHDRFAITAEEWVVR